MKLILTVAGTAPGFHRIPLYGRDAAHHELGTKVIKKMYNEKINKNILFFNNYLYICRNKTNI
jgi:hypothetical protein